MEGVVSKGFLIFAQNTNEVDYVREAYTLALSIKFSQAEINNVSIVTNDVVPELYKSVFDKVIPIPWYEGSAEDGSRFKAEHRWKLYHATPYDETIVLDSDMLMLEDIGIWWEYCKNYDIKYCSKVLNHKLESVVDTKYRRAFLSNNLSNPYAALHYFKKSPTAHEFYKILEFVCNNWEGIYGKYAPVSYQEWLSMDLSVAIAIELFGNFQSPIVDNCCPFEFIHMKPEIQGWDRTSDKWQDSVPYVLNSKGQLIVGNIRQSKLFHYVEKDFLTDTIIEKFERLVYGEKKA